MHPSFNMSHPPPPYCEDDRCIDRQYSGNLHGTHSRETRSSTPKMQPRSHAGGSLHTALSFMFHARKSQSPIFPETTRERASLRDQVCTTVLELGASLALVFGT